MASKAGAFDKQRVLQRGHSKRSPSESIEHVNHESKAFNKHLLTSSDILLNETPSNTVQHALHWAFL